MRRHSHLIDNHADFDFTAKQRQIVEARARGQYDAARGKSPLFRATATRGLLATIDDDMADAWDWDMRMAYLDGYNE